MRPATTTPLRKMPGSAIDWGIVVTLALAMAGVFLYALDERNRKKFLTVEAGASDKESLQKDIDGIGRKVERNTGLYVALDDRTGDLEEKVALLEERQTQQWSRISEQMSQTAATLRDVMVEVRAVASLQHSLALRMERLDAHFGRSQGGLNG